MIDDIKKTLWATADKLRANMDAAEYKHLVLGLIFVKYISDTFQAKRTELTARFANPADEYFLDGGTPADLAAELEDRDYYREANVFRVPEAARWEALRAAAKQTDIGKRIDEALSLIEAENPRLKNILDKRFARAQLPDGKLGELVDLVSTIGFGTSAREARDVLGQVYEYFLGMFASAEGKRGGQFYTPRSIMSSSQNNEGQIRAAMVDADVVEVMIALPGQLFFNTQIPACLWFLAKDKRARRGEVLFIDARKLATMISRVQCELTDAVIERIAGTVAAWRGEAAYGGVLS